MPSLPFWNSISRKISDSKIGHWTGKAAKVIKPKLEPASLVTSTAIATIDAIAVLQKNASPTFVNINVILTSVNHIFYYLLQQVEKSNLQQKIQKKVNCEPQVAAPYAPDLKGLRFFQLTQLVTLATGSIVPLIVAAANIDEERKSILVMQIVSLLVAGFASYGENNWLQGKDKASNIAIKTHRLKSAQFAAGVSATLDSNSYKVWQALGYDFEQIILCNLDELAVMRLQNIATLIQNKVLEPETALKKLQTENKRNLFEHGFMNTLVRNTETNTLHCHISEVFEIQDDHIRINNLDDILVQQLVRSSPGLRLAVALQLEPHHLAALNNETVKEAISAGQLSDQHLLETAENGIIALIEHCQQARSHYHP